MASKISYLVLFGIISVTSAKPDYRQDSNYGKNQIGLKKLLEDLYVQGNYDIALSHHEDGPESHHEDTAQISYHGGKQNNLRYDDKYHNPGSYQSPRAKRVDYNNHPNLRSTEGLNLLNKNKPENVATNADLRNNNNNTSNCTQIFGICTEITWDNDVDVKARNENKDVDEVLEFLKELDKNLEGNANYNVELRCYGNSCGENRYDKYNRNRDDDNEMNENDDRNNENYDRYNLRCRGNKCNRDIDSNYEYRNFRDVLRCRGGRCGRNRSDRDDVRKESDNLRCRGDRCGRNRNDDDNRDNGDNRDDIDSYRCAGDRCGRNRNDDDNRYDRDDGDNRDNSDIFLCIGDGCGKNRDDGDRNDSNLRCSGDRCGRTRIDDNTEDSKYENRVNDQIDKILSNLNDVETNERGLKLLDNKRKAITQIIKSYLAQIEE